MNQCVCRVFGILLVVIYTACTVEGVAFGVDCSGGETCTDSNTECPTSGTLECVCTSDSYRNSGDTACVLIVTTLAGSCITAETDAEQCTFANTECRADGDGGKCLCVAATHFSDGSACQSRIAFDQGCDSAVTDTNQCLIANQECSLETGTTYKCQCTSAYYSDGSGCVARIAPEVSCSANQCVEHATCDTTCKCDAGYTATPSTSPTMCSGVVKFASLSYMYVVPILVSMLSLLR